MTPDSASRLIRLAASAASSDKYIDGAAADKFNMLLISTDIPCEYDDDNNPVINGAPVEVSDVTVDMCGQEYTPVDGVKFKSDEKYLVIAVINAYADSTIDAAAMPAADGTISATFTVSGLGDTSGNAGLTFQMNSTWNYRNGFGVDGEASFPNAAVGVSGGAYGIDDALVCSDVAIAGDGTYTVSINTSGTITKANPDLEGTDPKTNGFYLDAEDSSKTRQGQPWSMLKNYEPNPDAPADSSADSTASSTDSTTDSKDSGSSSATSSSSSSAASTTSSKAGSTGTSTTSKTTSSTAASSAASDATESPEAGAAAGIALALAAVAGAAVVVTRKRG